jgi:hypothetical protein
MSAYPDFELVEKGSGAGSAAGVFVTKPVAVKQVAYSD